MHTILVHVNSNISNFNIFLKNRQDIIKEIVFLGVTIEVIKLLHVMLWEITFIPRLTSSTR